MPISRINHTGRRRIRREHVNIEVREEPGRPCSFEARFQLQGYRLPPSARVMVEAYRQSLSRRFDFGRWEHLSHPWTGVWQNSERSTVCFSVSRLPR